MTHPYDLLALDNGAQFIFTPCPGTKDADLTSSILSLKEAGADVIISMLPDSEIAKLNVTDLGKEIQQQGMLWYQLPVEDDQAPQQPFFDVLNTKKEELLTHLKEKKTIVIHCRGGTGRTGVMAACLLLESGYQWERAKALIQSIRPKALTIPAHVEFLKMNYEL
ncbi:tyrosine-protein phosphatase [Marinomonas sp. C2222]|uniref:Tyrosine-protein phosphatase n=1 Tax=Marinomonas sargassi TaxID=2984494 RepID=A0ABT2YW24_9GAMM|nr:tyrosine-protein phosphatase [Marinomonas sargassi]MCV2404058.1 tyrosine-protein phosphatase [Marinomonas sargassi]